MSDMNHERDSVWYFINSSDYTYTYTRLCEAAGMQKWPEARLARLRTRLLTIIRYNFDCLKRVRQYKFIYSYSMV